MLKHFTISKFHNFIKDHQIIQGAIMYIIGGLFSGVIKKINQQIIGPIVQLDFDELKNADYNDLLSNLIELLITSYFMFAIFQSVHIADL
jgi:large-conductance mechanosensitive channel